MQDNKAVKLQIKLSYECGNHVYHAFEGDAPYQKIKNKLAGVLLCQCGEQHRATDIVLSPLDDS